MYTQNNLPQENLLEAKNISFAYSKNKIILKDVNLTVKAGETIALTGPSGCGKSTLARILAGFLKPAAGEVLFNNLPLPGEGYNPVQLIFQHPEKAVNPRWKMERILNEAWTPPDDFLSSMGIQKEFLPRYPRELSGGEIQRFCIARALSPQTRVLVADEISTMLDVITAAQIWQVLLERVREQNISLIAITHNIHLAQKIAGRIVRVGRGEEMRDER